MRLKTYIKEGYGNKTQMLKNITKEFKDHDYLFPIYWYGKSANAEIKFWKNMMPDDFIQGKKEGMSDQSISDDVSTNAGNNFYDEMRKKYKMSEDEYAELGNSIKDKESFEERAKKILDNM